jgi:hypothetical protein
VADAAVGASNPVCLTYEYDMGSVARVRDKLGELRVVRDEC